MQQNEVYNDCLKRLRGFAPPQTSKIQNEDNKMELSHYIIKWHMAIFHTHPCNSKWSKFKRAYNKNFKHDGAINENKISLWPMNPERIEWIKENLPGGCSVKIISFTDKQFADHLNFYGRYKD